MLTTVIEGVFCFFMICIPSWSKPNYCIPTESCWPTLQDVSNLNSSLSSNALLLNSSNNKLLYNKYSTILNARYYSYPSWILVVKQLSDIQCGVKWAALHNIQISIINTGHSYTGRNTANYSLMIQLSQLKYYNISLDNNYITISAGYTWGEIYSILNSSSINRLIVGGSDLSVGVTGGYSLGGGHAFLTPFLGLSCDWIQYFTLIDSKGDIQIISNTSNDVNIQNIYWALKGGGGGTFGIVGDATFKLHNPLDITPSNQWTFYQSQWSFYEKPGINILTANNTINGIWYWMKNIMDNKWMGLIMVQQNIRYKGLIIITMFYSDTIDKAKENSQFLAVLSVNSKISPDFYQQGDNLNGGFLELFSNNNSTYNIDLFSGLVQNESLNEQYTNLNIDLILSNNVLQSGFYSSNTMVLIGGPGNNNINKNSSINPLWRDGRLILGVSVATSSNASQSTINSMTNYLKQKEEIWCNFSAGVYSNEENRDCTSCYDDPIYHSKWGNAFWGSQNYEKLIQIKTYWDPNNVFWCYHCVGDED